MKLYDRCMGQCCEDVTLKISPEELELSYHLWLRQREDRGHDDIKMSEDSKILDRLSHNIFKDIYLVYLMLIFSHKDNNHPEFSKDHPASKLDKENIYYHYKCKHYDKKNRKCTIYEVRPWMCRSYPNGKPCYNKGCQWRKQIKWRKEITKKKIVEKSLKQRL